MVPSVWAMGSCPWPGTRCGYGPWSPVPCLGSPCRVWLPGPEIQRIRRPLAWVACTPLPLVSVSMPGAPKRFGFLERVSLESALGALRVAHGDTRTPGREMPTPRLQSSSTAPEPLSPTTQRGRIGCRARAVPMVGRIRYRGDVGAQGARRANFRAFPPSHAL